MFSGAFGVSTMRRSAEISAIEPAAESPMADSPKTQSSISGWLMVLRVLWPLPSREASCGFWISDL